MSTPDQLPLPPAFILEGTIRPCDSFTTQTSLHLLATLTRFLYQQGCPTFAINTGYRHFDREWRLYILYSKPDITPGTHAKIREVFDGLVAREEPIQELVVESVQTISQPAMDLLWLWGDVRDPKWRHVSKVWVYDDEAYLVEKDGVKSGDEAWAVARASRGFFSTFAMNCLQFGPRESGAQRRRLSVEEVVQWILQ
ncbi:hypothetical protein BJX61DRAFT_544831 [Aspergillus egyptiacus]|nr:hypothetical protein BJX61DRAFT_544831 [Aspergillus egyptiacus]